MATRLYLDRNGFTPSPSFTPTYQSGEWGSDFSVTYSLAPAATATTSTYLTRTVSTSSSAGSICHALLYTPPIDGAYSFDGSTTYEMVIRASEEFSTQNCFMAVVVGFVNNEGTVQVVRSREQDGTEMTTSLTSKDNDLTGGITYTTSPGDRMFIEVGWNKTASVSGDISLQYGYSDSAGDLLGSGDAGVQNGWFETSVTLGFDPEGTNYNTSQSRLMLMGVG